MIHRPRPFGPVFAVLGLLLTATVATPLVSCSSTTATSTVASVTQAINDANTIVSGVSQSYQQIRALYPTAFSPAADAQIQTLLAAAPPILTQLSAAVNDPAATAGGLRGVESIVNQVVNIAAVSIGKIPNVPPSVLLGLQVASVLLPIVEATANTLVPVATVGLAPVRFPSTMTPAQARVALAR